MSKFSLLFGIVLTGFLIGSSQAMDTKIIVPFAAGGANDKIARLLVQNLPHSHAENITGAGGTIASNRLARSQPSDYWLILHSDAIIINDIIQNEKQYKLSDFSCIAHLGHSPLVLLSHKKSLKDLKNYSRPLNVGNSGMGSVTYYAGVQFAKIQNSQQIPYKGVAQTLNALLGKEIELMFNFVGTAHPYISSNKVYALAITGSTRNHLIPKVKTFKEMGFNQFDWSANLLLFSNNNLSPILQKFYNNQINKIFSNPKNNNLLKLEGIAFTVNDQDECKNRLTKIGYQWRDLTNRQIN